MKSWTVEHRKGVTQIKKSQTERERRLKFSQLSVKLTLLLSIEPMDPGTEGKHNKIMQRQRGEINSILPQCHPPFNPAVPPSLSPGGNVNLKVTEASHGGHAYPDRLDFCVCVCVCVFGACRLNPASLGSLTTSPSLWLALSESERDQRGKERERERRTNTQREILKELERKSGKKKKEREQSRVVVAAAKPNSSLCRHLEKVEYLCHSFPSFRLFLSSFWILFPHLPSHLPLFFFPTPLFPTFTVSKKLVYNATTYENEQLAPN